VHHRHEHRTQNLNRWRTLLYLWTAVIALLVHRTTSLGLIGAIVIGFVASAALLWCAYLAVHARNTKGPQT
jgi:uncharacterized metal-binding protein